MINPNVDLDDLCRYVTFNEKEEINGCRYAFHLPPKFWCPSRIMSNECPFVPPQAPWPACPFTDTWADLDTEDDELIAAIEEMQNAGFKPQEYRLEKTGPEDWRVVVQF